MQGANANPGGTSRQSKVPLEPCRRWAKVRARRRCVPTVPFDPAHEWGDRRREYVIIKDRLVRRTLPAALYVRPGGRWILTWPGDVDAPRQITTLNGSGDRPTTTCTFDVSPGFQMRVWLAAAEFRWLRPWLALGRFYPRSHPQGLGCDMSPRLYRGRVL
nr:hypothetical protein CFP56_03099 [Quercus suber]